MDNCNIFNVIIIGESGVGKSCLLLRYADNVYNSSSTITVGIDFKKKKLIINDIDIEVRLWDTAGLEKYRSLTEKYYEGADVILLCYDTTDSVALKQLDEWKKIYDIKTNKKGNQIIKCLIGLKIDNTEHRAISTEEGKLYAEQNNFYFSEISSKTNVNVDETFTTIFTNLLVLRNITKQYKNRSISCIKFDDDYENSNKYCC